MFPTTYVLAQSPLNPSFNATKSILTISPSFKMTFFEGIPCITSSFTEAHIEPGNGGIPLTPLGYPFSAGIAPFSLIVFSAILSSSHVDIPGLIASSIAFCVSAATWHASLIFSISCFDFIVTIFYYPVSLKPNLYYNIKTRKNKHFF